MTSQTQMRILTLSNYYSFYVIQLGNYSKEKQSLFKWCLHIIHSIFHNI